MRIVLQVVNHASVKIDEKVYNSIGKGYMILVGIGENDNEENVIKMAEKVSKLRINKDENGKTNLNIFSYQGEILSISQFTLYANTNCGNRPDFLSAAKKDKAIYLYDLFNKELRKHDLVVKEGVFGADMKVELENDGPFTLVIEN